MTEKNKKARTKSEDIALAAAKQAIKEMQEEERQKKKKRAFQNTNLLLEHYLDLKQYCDNAVYKIQDHEEELEHEIDEVIEDVTGEDISVMSIKRSKEITLIMISHVETALELLRKKSQSKGIEDRYSVLDMLHLDPSFQDIPWTERISTVADSLDCADSTVRRWRNDMVQDLSVFLFGMDGLRLEI